MKVTITLDDGRIFEAEGYYLPVIFEEVAQQADLIEEGDSVRFVSKAENYILDKG